MLRKTKNKWTYQLKNRIFIQIVKDLETIYHKIGNGWNKLTKIILAYGKATI